MDPFATWLEFLDACDNQCVETAINRLDDLISWYEKGGFHVAQIERVNSLTALRDWLDCALTFSLGEQNKNQS